MRRTVIPTTVLFSFVCQSVILPAALFLVALTGSPVAIHAQSSGKTSLRDTGKGVIKVTDLLKIRTLSELTISKDGRRIAFTVTRIEADPDSKMDYKYVNHIYVAPVDGSAPPKELTVKESSSQPAWSPDGKQLAFVRSIEGKTQIFILPLDGGEPVQFTRFRYGAGAPKWSPDGKKILFSSSIGLKDLLKDTLLNPGHSLPVWPYEQAGFDRNESLRAPGAPSSLAKQDPDGSPEEVRAYLDNNVTDKKAKVLTRLNFQDEMNVNMDLSFNHFFIQDLSPDALPVEVTHGYFRFTGADFTPDGKQLILTGDIDSTQHPDRSLETEIFIADADGKNLRLILGEKNISFTNPALSPSGKILAFQYGPTERIGIPELAIMPLNGKAGDKVKIPFDRSKGGFTWSADEEYLYFTAQSNGGAPLYRLNIQSKKIEQLTDFNSGIGSFALDTGRVLYVRTGVDDPFALYSAGTGGQNPKKFYSFNDEWLTTKQLSLPEKHEFKNGKGQTIEYWVMRPTNYVPGKKFPLLLDIHGGPSAMWGPGESSMWHEFQYYCAKGYGVVYGNPRGSGGYGNDFLRSNIEDWGSGPTSDVLSILDKTVAEGWADTSRLLVSGGSYAGYLVAWIVGHDHRFRAACAQRGVYDLETFFGEGNAWRLVPLYFGGYPWEPKVRAILQRESPISYVQQITTPLLIFHGENDRRTGFVQSEMLYRSLKVLNRPVEYIRHPGATHELTRSGDNRQRIDQLLRTYSFFERWLWK
ncbi:S9 family peptidase [Flavitalea flava]